MVVTKRTTTNFNIIKKFPYILRGLIFNLVIFDVRKDFHIVLDSTGKCIETFESLKATSGYYVGEDFSKNFIFEENGYKYEYINSNWFSRVFYTKNLKLLYQMIIILLY